MHTHHSNPKYHPLRREGRPLYSRFEVFHIWMQYKCKVHPRVWPAEHFFPLKHWRRNGVCETKQLLCKKAKCKVTGLLFTSSYPQILLGSGLNDCTNKLFLPVLRQFQLFWSSLCLICNKLQLHFWSIIYMLLNLDRSVKNSVCSKELFLLHSQK